VAGPRTFGSSALGLWLVLPPNPTCVQAARAGGPPPPSHGMHGALKAPAGCCSQGWTGGYAGRARACTHRADDVAAARKNPILPPNPTCRRPVQATPSHGRAPTGLTMKLPPLSCRL
jgi:hypothetical protein